MARDDLALSTRLIHAGEPRIEGAVVMPVFQSAPYEYGGSSKCREVRYARLNNTPNHRVLHEKLAAVEGAEAALVTGSGMAAISATLLALLDAGDRVLVHDTLYGGTHGFLHHDLPKLGIGVDVVDARRPATWKAVLERRTRLFWVETLGNPLLAVPDHRAVVAFAREHGLVAATDNTFATPVNFRPVPFGYDLVVHSATKYLNGHSDVVAGVVAGRLDLVERIGEKLVHLGGTLDPHACFLLQRGLKTLVLRVKAQNRGAMEVARFLEAHPRVRNVAYPGLPSHPDHERARELFEGFGGMLSFEVEGGADAAEGLFRRLRVPVVGVSLGGVETLVSRPAVTSHMSLTPEERAERGIADGLIRMSVGIEEPADLISDLDRALP